MNDLTAWVELWEIVPELVPPGWEKHTSHGVTSWVRDKDREFHYPDSCQPIDIYAQIGKAVEWLHEHRMSSDPSDALSTLDSMHRLCSYVLQRTGRLPQSPTA